ncbi:MAG: hypothetical protein MJY92_07535 [Bacteroidales bacterium]|nr:hypothetical protein [Bacteroidales bacterium]
MSLNDFVKPVEMLSEDAVSMLEDKKDKILLFTAKTLSKTIARFLAAIVLVLCCSCIFLTLSMLGIFAVGELVGSFTLGALIVLALQTVILIILLCMRSKLFVNTFVKFFINLFYGE